MEDPHNEHSSVCQIKSQTEWRWAEDYNIDRVERMIVRVEGLIFHIINSRPRRTHPQRWCVVLSDKKALLSGNQQRNSVYFTVPSIDNSVVSMIKQLNIDVFLVCLDCMYTMLGKYWWFATGKTGQDIKWQMKYKTILPTNAPFIKT